MKNILYEAGGWIPEFETSLVYRVSSRTARTTERNPVSKKQNKTKKQQNPLNFNIHLSLQREVWRGLMMDSSMAYLWRAGPHGASGALTASGRYFVVSALRNSKGARKGAGDLNTYIHTDGDKWDTGHP